MLAYGVLIYLAASRSRKKRLTIFREHYREYSDNIKRMRNRAGFGSYMTTQQRITSLLYKLKHTPYSDREVIAVHDEYHEHVADLECFALDLLENTEIVSLCAKWRKTHEWWFPKQFNVTTEGTRNWLKNGVIEVEGRLLFFIVYNGVRIGHIGLYRFDYEHNSCELDNVLKGESAPKGLMTFVTKTLMQWTHTNLGISKMTLRVFSDNDKAIALYTRVGFTKVKNIPLRKIFGSGEVAWEEDESMKGSCEREYVLMQHIFI